MPPAQRFFRNLADTQRLALISLEGDELAVRAQFNPHEVQVEKSIAWSEQPTPGANAPHLEYTTGNSRSMSLELMFDCYEDRTASIQPALETLHKLALAPNPGGRKPSDRMPPVIEVVNGPVPGFRCVIESLAVKATMFDKQMVPVRATVSLKLKEVTRKDLKAARQLAGQDERVLRGYQPAGARDQAERDAAYREWEQDRFARNATEFPELDPADERAQWLADNKITLE